MRKRTTLHKKSAASLENYSAFMHAAQTLGVMSFSTMSLPGFSAE